MKSIFLTLSVAVCFNCLFCNASFAQNYSLWPKRPPEIERARALVQNQQFDDAVELMQTYVKAEGVVGREARKITASVNTRKYLSRLHPAASIYTVRAGDTLTRIVNTTHCPSEVIMLLNGIVDPSALKAGQKLVVVKADLRVEVYPAQQEICVWDEDVLVASYDIESSTLPLNGKSIQTKVSAREGYINGEALPLRSTHFLGSDRVLKLDGGGAICGSHILPGAVIKLAPPDMNELALLVSVGAQVFIYDSAPDGA